MASAGSSESVIKKYLPVYFALLAISATEVLLAYRNIATPTLVVLFLALAISGATLGVMYFMHLADERRSLLLSLIPAAIFILLLMNAIWPDSLRLLHMRPFAH
jgi:cytochrome c oxidase subunit IV